MDGFLSIFHYGNLSGSSPNRLPVLLYRQTLTCSRGFPPGIKRDGALNDDFGVDLNPFYKGLEEGFLLHKGAFFKLNKRVRNVILEWIKQQAARIIEAMKDTSKRAVDAAWRIHL